MSPHGGYVPTGHVAYNTPESLLVPVRKVFGGTIDLDPCSNETSTVRARVEYRLPVNDGLLDPWDGPNIFVNPPFGAGHLGGLISGIEDWVRRCASVGDEPGKSVLLLCPAWTDVTWWHDIVWKRFRLACFLRGRVEYLLKGFRPEYGPPMGSAMVLFSRQIAVIERFHDEFGPLGHVVHGARYMVSERDMKETRALMRERGRKR